MVREVNKLAKNLLTTVRVLCLPGIGTLRVERVGAKRLSKRSILPPHLIVTFSPQEEGEPFPDAIARAARCDREQALTVYERWRSYELADGVLTIEGVGVLREKHFTPDAAFDKQLNPQGYAPIKLRPTRRFDWAIWCGIVAILLAVGFGGYQFLQMQPDQGEELPELTEQTVVGADAAAEQADALAEAVVPAIATEKAESVDSADNAAAAANSSAERVSAVPVGRQPESSDKGENTAADRPVEIPAAKSVISSQPAANTAAEPAKLISGRRYVVIGVFSTSENAARAVQNAEKRVPGIHCSVYLFGKKWMVSPFDAQDAAACARFVNEYNDRLPDIWVYTAR